MVLLLLFLQILVALSVDLDNQIKINGSVNFVNVNKILKSCGEIKDKEIIIDFSLVERIDETALERLASLNRAMAKEERALFFVNLSERVQKRYDRFFKVV